jgi:hypothetical protein
MLVSTLKTQSCEKFSLPKQHKHYKKLKSFVVKAYLNNFSLVIEDEAKRDNYCKLNASFLKPVIT